MVFEVINTNLHRKRLEKGREVFPSEKLAKEYVYRSGYFDTPGIILREVEKRENYFSVVKQSQEEEYRVKKNLTEREAKSFAEDKKDLEAKLNTVDIALLNMK